MKLQLSRQLKSEYNNQRAKSSGTATGGRQRQRASTPASHERPFGARPNARTPTPPVRVRSRPIQSRKPPLAPPKPNPTPHVCYALASPSARASLRIQQGVSSWDRGGGLKKLPAASAAVGAVAPKPCAPQAKSRFHQTKSRPQGRHISKPTGKSQRPQAKR